jgi:F-type H+-transporting ATPase subunit delta
MSLRASATRYAKALLEIAAAESDPARVEQDLAGLVSAMTTHAELRQALTSPTVPAQARRGIVRSLVAQAGVAAPLPKLLDLLAERGRLELLPEILQAYRERLLAHQNIVQAEVASAAPLAPETFQQLSHRLSALTGKQVQLAATVDAALIGGLVARVGSTVYDGSVRTQLEKMKQQLIEARD